jgi:hypothetical protein
MRSERDSAMAEIVKGTGSNKSSLSSLTPPPSNRLPGQAGEAITAGDACRLNSSGVIVKSTGAAATNAANVDGFADRDCDTGDDITLIINERFHYGTGLTPGASLFLSGTVAGGLADAASTGGTEPVAFVLADGKRVQTFRTIRR